MNMNGLLRSAQLGAASGLRSMAAPAQLSRTLAGSQPTKSFGPVAEFLSHGSVSAVLQVAAIGEMIADKLPIVPDRIEPGPLAGRVLFGGTAGGVCARIQGESAWVGVLVVGFAAVAGAFAGYHLRRFLVHEVGVPDLPVALCEDAVAIALARAALSG